MVTFLISEKMWINYFFPPHNPFLGHINQGANNSGGDIINQ